MQGTGCLVFEDNNQFVLMPTEQSWPWQEPQWRGICRNGGSCMGAYMEKFVVFLNPTSNAAV